MSTRLKRPIIAACLLSLLTLTGCACCRDYFAWNHTPPYDPTPENFGSYAPGFPDWNSSLSRSEVRDQLNRSMQNNIRR